jgi:hypothetical protein
LQHIGSNWQLKMGISTQRTWKEIGWVQRNIRILYNIDGLGCMALKYL